MKIFLFVICVASAIAGCKKGTLEPVGLIGTWELRHYSGTIAGVSRNCLLAMASCYNLVQIVPTKALPILSRITRALLK
jgi:hypothetical protein